MQAHAFGALTRGTDNASPKADFARIEQVTAGRQPMVALAAAVVRAADSVLFVLADDVRAVIASPRGEHGDLLEFSAAGPDIGSDGS